MMKILLVTSLILINNDILPCERLQKKAALIAVLDFMFQIIGEVQEDVKNYIRFQKVLLDLVFVVQNVEKEQAHLQ